MVIPIFFIILLSAAVTAKIILSNSLYFDTGIPSPGEQAKKSSAELI